jgi:hypothetical protein
MIRRKQGCAKCKWWGFGEIFCSSYGVEEKINFNTIKLCVGFLCLGNVIIIHFLLHN